MAKARHVAILAGGKGTRFWPLGRESRPKQMLALDGDDPRPLLRATWDRVAPLADAQGPWVVASETLGREIRRILPEVAEKRLILEPAPKNTAAAIITVGAAIGWEDDDATILVVPSDHHVAPLSAYRRALDAMLSRAASADTIVTLGLRPTRPATGYGYMRLGPKRGTTPAGPVHAVSRFVEKPDARRAARFVRDGRHLWNGGTFAFSWTTLFEEVGDLCREADEGVLALFGARRRWRRALKQVYARMPSISFDHAVMERSDCVETVAARLDWDDLGSFDAVLRHAKADAVGNVLPKGAVAVDSKGCLVRADDGAAVALLGVENLIVVRTKDALLVAKRGRGEDVRQVVERWKAAGREDLLA